MQTYITKFGKGPHEGWEWDGKILKPFGQGPYPHGWEWDGKIFKPYGQGPYPHGWEWDGKIFKPYGQGPYPHGWEWDEKIFKPYGQGPHPDGWEINGYMPIFAVAFVSILMKINIDKNNIESSLRGASIKSKSSKKGVSSYEELGQLAAMQLFNVVEKMIKRVINLIRTRIK